MDACTCSADHCLCLRKRKINFKYCPQTMRAPLHVGFLLTSFSEWPQKEPVAHSPWGRCLQGVTPSSQPQQREVLSRNSRVITATNTTQPTFSPTNLQHPNRPGIQSTSTAEPPDVSHLASTSAECSVTWCSPALATPRHDGVRHLSGVFGKKKRILLKLRILKYRDFTAPKVQRCQMQHEDVLPAAALVP